jgi:hypothetical protein
MEKGTARDRDSDGTKDRQGTDRQTYAHTMYSACLALDLVMVSDIGVFSFIELLENNSTNSSKSTDGSSIFSQTKEPLASLK